METVARLQPHAQARLVATRSRDERANPDLLGRLIAHLRGRGWVHRRQLRTDLNLTDDALRALARYSRGEVIGSSARGYGLTREVPVGDVHAVIAESLSRSKQLRARVSEIFRVLHGQPRAKYSSNTSVEAVSDGIGGAA